MTFDISNVGLPKWPALVVRGERVSVEQAAEIIVRTDSWRLSTNDRQWGRQVRELVGLRPDPWEGPSSNRTLQEITADIDHDETIRAGLGVLELEYLRNSQIASCWIGGPHGWCHWNGRIGSDNYNIGKWPSAEEVMGEWSLIAAAFPFLKLTCQLFNGETCEEGTRPVIEYVVAERKVTAREPSDFTMMPNDGDTESLVADIVMGRLGRERGCTIEQLKRAVDLVRSTRE